MTPYERPAQTAWDKQINNSKTFRMIYSGEREGKMHQKPESREFSEANWTHVPAAVKLVEQLGGTVTAAIYLFREEQEKKQMVPA